MTLLLTHMDHLTPRLFYLLLFTMHTKSCHSTTKVNILSNLLSLFSEPADNYCIALDEFHTWYTNILERNVSKIQRDCFCPKTIILHKEVETFDTLQYLGTIRQETSLGYQHSTYCEEGSTVPLPSLEV